jgi:superfamily II DNA/RNA helicase
LIIFLLGKAILLPAFQQLLLAKKNPPPPPPPPPQQNETAGSTRKRYASKSPTVLVLAPTPELTVQIEKEAYKYCSAGVRSACLYGGSPKGPQIQQLPDGVDVAICTPGRCNDLNIMGALDLSQVKYLVLDEADRMYVSIRFISFILNEIGLILCLLKVGYGFRASDS